MDRQAEAQGISIEALMHEAGRALAACVVEHYGHAKRIAVFCGKGNNGGDGFVAARLLAERQLQVDVRVAAAEKDLNPNAQREAERLREVGVTPHFGLTDAPIDLRMDLVIDAVLGTGVKGAPAGAAASAIEAIGSADCPVLAADIPSGVDCDTGATPGIAVRADRTVTFGLPKPFLFQGSGMDLAGAWTVAPIGFPASLLEASRAARITTPSEARAWLPLRAKSAHKGSEGHVLIVAGNDRMPGAAVLCARAALRAGAGLVSVASSDVVCRVVAAHLPEAIFLALPDEDALLGPNSAQPLLAARRSFDAVVVGPGLGDWPEVGLFLEEWLPKLKVPTVVDADALSLLAKGAFRPGGPTVLTPHPGEAGRLLGIETVDVQADRFQSADALARKFGAVALLKGAYTVAADGATPLRINPTGNPGMAAPGTGDVLAGVVGALLAKGLSPFAAASLGAYWHGLAGDLCAAEIGPAGFLASELADRLPRARATIASS